jgi:Na+/melibiose symporter-like transporter
LIAGIVVTTVSFRRVLANGGSLLRFGGIILVAAGVLLQGDSASWFFGLLGLAILTLLLVRPAADCFRDIRRWVRESAQKRKEKAEQPTANPLLPVGDSAPNGATT